VQRFEEILRQEIEQMMNWEVKVGHTRTDTAESKAFSDWSASAAAAAVLPHDDPETLT
jgi:hypothetical protein